MSAISITPALRVWMPSPDSGTSTRTVVSAVRAMSSSVCPTPTVSTSTRSKPNASSRSATSSVVVASPPCAPRVAIERMNTPGSRLTDSIRIRSPSSAPPVNALVGSTATTPTERRWARKRWISASVSVLLPAPGGPVMPARRVPPRPSNPCAYDNTRSNPSRWFSTRVMARANAAVSRRASPSRIRSVVTPDSCFRPARFGALERHGAHRPRPHGDPLHAGSGSGENVELEPVQREALTRSGDASQRLHQQPRHGLDPAGFQGDAEPLLEPAGRGAALQLDDPHGRLVAGGRLPRLEDLRHQVAEQVLECDQACCPAELVQHDGEVAAAALHFQHEVGRPRGARHDERRQEGDGRVGGQT